MKENSNQAGCLPSVMTIIKDYMVERGFRESSIRVTDYHVDYDWWGFACFGKEGKVYLIPFLTNTPVCVDPADPKFFSLLEESLSFPREGNLFWTMWRTKLHLIPPKYA